MRDILGSRQRGRTAAKTIRVRQKHSKVLELRLEGWTFPDIAKELGYSDESGARKAAQRLIDRYEYENVTDYRKLTLMRYEALYKIAYAQIYYKDENGHRRVNLWAMDRCITIQQNISVLLGLNAPTQIDLTVDWREELREQGIDDSEIFNQIVATIAAESVSN